MVTALGCFGGDFNIDNGLLLSCSHKVSDVLSDKFSGLYASAQNATPKFLGGRERPHGHRDAPCVKGWGRSRPHIVPLVQSDRLWNVYLIKLSSFAGSPRSQ